jgi:hypothetical protein
MRGRKPTLIHVNTYSLWHAESSTPTILAWTCCGRQLRQDDSGSVEPPRHDGAVVREILGKVACHEEGGEAGRQLTDVTGAREAWLIVLDQVAD